MLSPVYALISTCCSGTSGASEGEEDIEAEGLVDNDVETDGRSANVTAVELSCPVLFPILLGSSAPGVVTIFEAITTYALLFDAPPASEYVALE